MLHNHMDAKSLFCHLKNRLKTVRNFPLRICLFLFLSSPAAYSGNVLAQGTKISLQLKNTSVREIFKEIERAGRYVFVLSDNLGADLNKKIDLNVHAQSVDDVLRYVTKDTELQYNILENQVVIYKKNAARKEKPIGAAPPQARETIKGTVVDVKGEPLIGVSIRSKTGEGISVTNLKGEFEINTDKEELTLTFSSIGMKTREQKVKKGQPANVVLEDDVNKINEVVVTGIFNKPKESFTGAAVRLTKDELVKAGNRNILQSISRLDPSFVIIDNPVSGSNPNRLPDIQIRGTSTLPTISDFQGTVRGNLNTPLFILDGFEISLERVMDLNNHEIKSVTILKDAGATAIYGSRGSNGVLVITSVKPEKGRLRVSYNGMVNLEIPDLNSYNLMNAREKLQLEWDAGLYNNTKNNIDADDLKYKRIYARKLERVLAGVNTNWLTIPVQTGVGSSHWVGINGGDDSFKYSMGLSYNDIRGAMKGSLRQTINGNVDLAYQHKLFSFNNSTLIGLNKSEESPYGSFYDYVKMNPYWEPFNEKGLPVLEFETESNPIFDSAVPNPLYNKYLGNFDRSKYTSITNNASVNITPIPELMATIRFSFSKNFSNNDHFRSPNSKEATLYGEDLFKRGSRAYGGGESSSWALSGTLSYFKTWDKHILTGGLNVEAREENYENIGFEVEGFLNDQMIGYNNAHQYRGQRPSNSEGTSRHIGLVGTLNYNYDNRYFVDASYRTDGSSSFGSQSRFAPFWSAGAGWTISNEPLIKKRLPFISTMRLKYSYGVTGSMNFSPWQSIGTYNYSDITYQGAVGAQISGLENKELKWQNTYQQNVGFDFGVFDNRASLSANYYHKITDNSITQMAIPLSTGFTYYMGNQGVILNTGFDLSASVYLLRNLSKRLYWTVTFGTFHNTNKLLSLSAAVKERMNDLRGQQSRGLYYVYQEGESVDAIYAIRTAGVDPATGRLVYVYKDGTQSYTYDVTQRVVCGDRMPKLDGRMNTSLSYKGLSVYMGFTLRWGGQQYNDTYANKVENINYQINADKRVLENRWQKPGDQSLLPMLNLAYEMNDRYVQNENTLTCNNINITYNLPDKWVRNTLKLTSLSVTGSLSNVFYISTIRQERGTGYPYAIQPSFGFYLSL